MSILIILIGSAMLSTSAEAVVGASPLLDMEQCRKLYASLDSGADKLSAVLFSPTVKFAVQRGGTLCNVHWPQQDKCFGRWVLPASKSRRAVEVQCEYHEDRNVCGCLAQGVASEAALEAVGDGAQAVRLAPVAPEVPLPPAKVFRALMRPAKPKQTSARVKDDILLQ
mmetsp:Transcript_20456/g.32616  ORF Transcript_20456/g.32616 Transcript_20456/m.32616 type:complete len:168 (-) Transcript_20456:135-638(-)